MFSGVMPFLTVFSFTDSSFTIPDIAPNDLAAFANDQTFLNPHERDMDFLALKNSYTKKELF